ncbi:MAG: DUF1003 domain-containing protein [Alphaproteobacteria bacterium]
MTQVRHRVHLTEEELAELKRLRAARRERRAEPELSVGQRVADLVAATMGSWRFIVIQSAILIVWIALNVMGWIGAWDPYPFILLNLALSFQAAYAAPFIMMSQNRQSEIDRRRAMDDYDINVKAELEIELLHEKMDLLRDQEIARLTRIIEDLVQRMDAKPA